MLLLGVRYYIKSTSMSNLTHDSGLSQTLRERAGLGSESLSPEPQLDTFGGKFLYIFEDPVVLVTFLGSLLLILTYYAVVYKRNRHMPSAAIDLVTTPPYSLSPAAIRYIAGMAYDTKCLTVGIINASIKGCYRIRWGKRGFLALQSSDADWDMLTNDEKSALSYRKEHYWQKISIGGTISVKAKKMGDRMHIYLKRRYGDLFDRKTKWIILGCMISFAFCALIFGLAHGQRSFLNFLGYGMVVSVSILMPLYFLKISLEDKYWFGLSICIIWLAVGFSLAGMIEATPGTPLYTPVFLPFIIINYIFFRISPTYTQYGKHVMEQVIGYKIYLSNRFNGSQPVLRDNDRLIHELPYAMAMDIDSTKTDYFKSILSRQKYQPFKMWDTLLKS